MTGSWDTVVIGGGPAGSSAAISAARLGCRVLVLEAEVFPRPHVGESLVNLWTVFDDLGVAEEMDATFEHKMGQTRLWGKSPEPVSLSFDYLPGPRKYSLQVERSLFDLILLRRAEALGATVCQGHRVSEVLWEGERAVGVRYTTPDGETQEVRAPFIVDGTGRDGLIARQWNLREIDPFYPDFSVYGYFGRAGRLPGDQAGNLIAEAVPRGWLWFIPLHTGEVSVGLVCDRTSRGELRERGLSGYFEEAIAQSQLVRGLLEGAELVRGPIGTASYGYRSRCYAGPGWMLAGDAGAFIDPMWATGVANALQDGILAGAMVEAVVSGRVPEEMVIEEFNYRVRKRIDFFHRGVRFMYRGNRLFADQPFWQERQRYVADDPLPVDLIRRLATDPSAGYVLHAFRGADLPADFFALFDGTATRSRTNDEALRLVRQPDKWVPTLDSHVVLRPALAKASPHLAPGAPGGHLVPGLEVRSLDDEIYIGDPYVVSALSQIDGQRSLQQIVDSVLAAVPPRQQLAARVRLMLAFTGAYQGGMLARDDLAS